MGKVYWLVFLWFCMMVQSAVWAQCPSAVSIRISQVNDPSQLAYNSFCRGEQVQLNANLTGGGAGLTYQWKRNGENLPNGTSATYLANSSGYFTVTVQGSGGCTLTSLPATIEVNDCQPTGRARVRGVYLEDYVIGAPNPLLRLGFLTYKSELAKFPQTLRVNVYQKSNNQLISTFTLQRFSTVERNLLSLDAACGIESTQLYDVLYFKATPAGEPDYFNFDPAIYNDPGGYYLVSEGVCCREPMDNLAAGTSPVVGYLELSARQQYNVTLGPLGSMFGGVYNLVSKVETCTGQPVKIDYLDPRNPLGVTRTDNALFQSNNVTRIQYSLETPLTTSSSSPFFDRVNYLPGFSATNFTGSNLQINASTGTITGTPTRPGSYAYVVKAETYNGTTRLSEMRREVQLIVKECPVSPQPKITLSQVGNTAVAGKNPICPGQRVQLNAVGGIPGGTYQWQKDGQNITGATSPTLLVDDGGVYTVSLEKATSCPPFALSDPLTVTLTAPRISLAQGPVSGSDCQNVRVELQATAVVNDVGSTFSWFLDGTRVPGVSGNLYSTSVAGQYTVQVSQPDGCTAISTPVSVSVATISQPVAPTIVPSNTQLCPGGLINLFTTPTSGYTYQWLLEGQPIAGATSNVLSATQAGAYTLRVQTANNCQALSKPVTLSALTPPVIGIKGEAQVCPGSSTSLALANQNQSTGGWQFFWQRNGATVGTLPIYQATTQGTYRLRITDANGCTAVSPDWLIIEQTAITVQMAPLAAVCVSPASPVTLSATPAGGVFSGPGVSGGQFNPTAAGAGTHRITYTLTGSSSCLSGSAVQSVEVRALPTVSLPAQLTTLNGTPVILAPVVVNAGSPGSTSYTYSWTPPETLNNPAFQTPTATPTQTTTYRLQIRDVFGCATEGAVLVLVSEPLVKLFVPNAFTPNSDGRNDTWQLWGIEQFPQIDVTVYNRWGEVVFHSLGYQTPFDGFYRGERIPSGMYTYVIRYDAREQPLRGTLMVIY
jgi:gliding motility-associated-like protein